MGDCKMLPCSGCGADLAKIEAEETTTTITVTAEPVFAGKRGEREVPALVCSKCNEVTAL